MSRPDVEALLAAFRADIAAATTPEAVDEVRRKHAGKKSPLKESLRSLKDVPAEERPAVAVLPLRNETSEHIDSALDALISDIETTLVNGGHVRVINAMQQPELVAEVRRGARRRARHELPQ